MMVMFREERPNVVGGAGLACGMVVLLFAAVFVVLLGVVGLMQMLPMWRSRC